MKSDKIRLTLGDWQWNASVIGFINIVGEENVCHIEADTVEFWPEALDGFENKYFAYFINTYEKTLSWYKIVNFQDRLNTYEENNFEEFDLKALEFLNVYIKDVKRYIKSNSYKAAYELIDSEVELLSFEKQLITIKEPKNQQRFDVDKSEIVNEVKRRFLLLQQIINYCASSEGRRYIGAKNAIYNIINNAWNGVSFLNSQTKEKNIYSDYKSYFVDTATGYLQSEKGKYKYNCFVCDAPIKDMSNDLSFLNATGFDVARKSSHVWNFQNDITICPLCKLIYSCLPAGIIYTYNRGIYINQTIKLKDAVRINNKIKSRILRSQDGSMRPIYHALVSVLHEQENDSAKYELADVQVVRYENESYRFNILAKPMLQIIVNSKKELDSLIRVNFIENGRNINVYDEVIGRIFNNQNLFTLIHKMLYGKLSDASKCYFNGSHVRNVLIINQLICSRLGGMKMDNTYLVKKSREAGESLRNKYFNKDSNHKLAGICYRLLNALKTTNENMFMDVTLNCYLYVNSQVPKVITDALGRGKDFSTMGYAFVSGLIDGQDGSGNKEKKAEGE
ncbi:CRISPR-associated CXXC_CXXC protein Cst1 [Desulfofarcimen acetoxidans DSM 771]|uniref:CRISPR-associated CXXC_CXXC protein Cst1 n=1 Tax=Desulfofarcimen acetoxidans (strain ATCC 49208 / DSM 771 / KCTC 5769 / VKM B-1644 / 5575) TaxID=485916 RepID=C8W341_DESAS|nr:type I-B CRISPR-associated protein Cas8b1/Cst1 [Desulfofarcimen acetoxidans]ACV61808.1 CRISPR-associated CXXC_CXXC protein Cst1 [Desulfofarcimen acetoxidans DSM 771]